MKLAGKQLHWLAKLAGRRIAHLLLLPLYSLMSRWLEHTWVGETRCTFRDPDPSRRRVHLISKPGRGEARGTAAGDKDEAKRPPCFVAPINAQQGQLAMARIATARLIHPSANRILQSAGSVRAGTLAITPGVSSRESVGRYLPGETSAGRPWARPAWPSSAAHAAQRAILRRSRPHKTSLDDFLEVRL